MTAASDTREAWLIGAAREISELFAAVGEKVPDLHLSVGFPGGTSNRKKTIGQCWPTSASTWCDRSDSPTARPATNAPRASDTPNNVET